MLNFSKILFLDIETVPKYPEFRGLSELEKELFCEKTKYLRNEGKPDEIKCENFYEKAGIWAEFGKIICISVGYIFEKNKEPFFKVKSFYGDDEYKLLQEFKNVLERNFNFKLCAHNGKEFDFPFISRRMIAGKIPLPDSLKNQGKKPWEIPHLDTMELWKFGDYKHFTSLKLLCYLLEIPSPKQDIDGSLIFEYYYQKKDLKTIVKYCERDVLAVAQVLLRMNHEPLIHQENVIFTSF